MIRIMTATEPDAITITMDGRLAGEYVEAIHRCVNQAIADGRPVHLVLRDVPTIDESGRKLLGRLARMGVRLSAAGVDSSYVAAEISASAEPVGRRRNNDQQRDLRSRPRSANY